MKLQNIFFKKTGYNNMGVIKNVKNEIGFTSLCLLHLLFALCVFFIFFIFFTTFLETS